MIQDLTYAVELGPPKAPAKVVKPRQLQKLHMPIAVADGEGKVWYEERPDVHGWSMPGLVAYLRETWPMQPNGERTAPIMLVCHNPHKVLLELHKAYKNDPEWNYRLSVSEGDMFYIGANKKKPPKVKIDQNLRIGYMGFRSATRRTKYFHPITPLDFMDDFSSVYGDPSWDEWMRLYKFGGHLRAWIKRHKLKFSASRGGLASQLLRDRKFYPEVRRKVPKKTNEKTRLALPGNFYAARERTRGKIYPRVYIIDQENAHHYAASTVNLPNANTLFAHGRFLSMEDKPYADSKSETYRLLMQEHGLFRVLAVIPPKLQAEYLPDWTLPSNGKMHRGVAMRYVYLYSNEIEYAKSLGIEIRHISQAWLSPDIDPALKTYSSWAQSEVQRIPQQKHWLKGVLLASYGILGSRPRYLENAYWQSDKGKPERYFIGGQPLDLQMVRTKREFQSPIANVIQRGMIEAETRKLSSQMAIQLESEGHDILAIHADALIVNDEGQQLPLLPPPWRVKDRLTGFRAIDKVSFKSDTMVVLPGRKRVAKAKR